MNNSQEIILAQISAIYDKPPFVKVKTGQMEMILKCVGLGKYYDEYAKYDLNLICSCHDVGDLETALDTVQQTKYNSYCESGRWHGKSKRVAKSSRLIWNGTGSDLLLPGCRGFPANRRWKKYFRIALWNYKMVS